MSVSITVITPCLNARATLPATLQSIQEQNYPNLDHVVIDGGSSDGTVELLQATPTLRFTSEPDRGLSHALNKGIASARGELIGWLNADDIYLPHALERVAAAYRENHEPLWLTGRCAIIDQSGLEQRAWVTRYKDFFVRRYSYSLHLTQNFVSAPSTFVAAKGFELVGGFDERWKYAMDYDLWLRLGKHQRPVIIDHPLAAFRMWERSLSMTAFEQQFVEHYQIASEHGVGRPVPVAVNRLTSRVIVGVYRALRWTRTRGERGG